MKGGWGALLRRTQQLHAEREKARQTLGQMEVRGQPGGGLVTVRMNGRHEVRRMRSAAQLSAGDRAMIEDLIAAAVHDAVNRVEALLRERYAEIIAGLPLPGDVPPPF